MTKDELIELAQVGMGIHSPNQPEYIVCEALIKALAQPEQEPVTWRYKIVDVFGRPAWTLKTPKSDTRVLESQPLYTTPPQRKPLTNKEIGAILDDPNIAEKHQGNWLVLPYSYARAIEAAHGIKGEA